MARKNFPGLSLPGMPVFPRKKMRPPSAAPIAKKAPAVPPLALPSVASDIAGKPKVVKKKKGPPMVGVLSSMNGKGY